MKSHNPYQSRRKPIFSGDILYVLFVLELMVVFFAVSHSAFADGFDRGENRVHYAVDYSAPFATDLWSADHCVQATPAVTYNAVTAGDIYPCEISDDNVVVSWDVNHVGQGTAPVSSP